jgi:hypothetical protein
MKSPSLSKILFIIIAITSIFLFQSCAKKINFANSEVVPGAEGRVKLKKDRNKNYSMDIDIVNLAQPDKLNPPRQTYVVWVQTEDNGQKNVGQLKTSSGLFSKALKASLEAVTPYRPVSVYITAEDDASIQYPGSQVVLRTDRF